MEELANYAIAALIGGAVGLAELVSRYRDRPTQIAQRVAAWMYIGLNALAATAALLLIQRFDWTFGQTGAAAVTTQVLVAGIGSAALFRSSLFIVKFGDVDVAVGPSQLLISLLSAADRSVDRAQAAERLTSVTASMKDVDFAKAQGSLVAACLASAANVSADEAKALRDSVGALERDASMGGLGKSVVLGLLILSVVGPEVLKDAVASLGDSIKA